MVMPCWTASARILSARRCSGAIRLLSFHIQAGAQPGLSATDAHWVAADGKTIYHAPAEPDSHTYTDSPTYTILTER
jgi:hypothetical protein